ncbi:MAG TPA: VOC family protein [Acidimicrobiales bacterium]|nr:VOC family protein [Acidimicrobiales bacterium]
MTLELDHVQVAIGEGSEAACDAFYVTLLGFEIVTKPPVLARRGGRWYQRGPVTLHLGVDPQFRPARKAHVALRVGDYDDLMVRLEGAGVATRPDEHLEGTRRCYVDDPVGNRMELIDANSLR